MCKLTINSNKRKQNNVNGRIQKSISYVYKFFFFIAKCRFYLTPIIGETVVEKILASKTKN